MFATIACTAYTVPNGTDALTRCAVLVLFDFHKFLSIQSRSPRGTGSVQPSGIALLETTASKRPGRPRNGTGSRSHAARFTSVR